MSGDTDRAVEAGLEPDDAAALDSTDLRGALDNAITWLDAEVAHPRPDPHPAMQRLADDLRAALFVSPRSDTALDRFRAIEAAARDVADRSPLDTDGETLDEWCHYCVWVVYMTQGELVPCRHRPIGTDGGQGCDSGNGS